MKERRPARDAEADGIIEGRNAVIEALRAGTPVDKIYLARGETDSALGHIASTARSRHPAAYSTFWSNVRSVMVDTSVDKRVDISYIQKVCIMPKEKRRQPDVIIHSE